MFEARGIAKCFGRSMLLDGVDLSIRPGEVVGLSGGNGSGKSTLIDIFMGRTLPDAGDVRVDGRIAVTSKRANRSKVFRTYQVPRLFFGMTIAENLCLGQWAFGSNSGGNGTVDGLPDHAQLARILSVGQRRRVVLEWLKARVGYCQYFLLDEPTAGADSDYIAEMGRFIKTSKSKGVGFLVVEHKPEFLQRVSDRMLVLQQGTVMPNGIGVHAGLPVPSPIPVSNCGGQSILQAEGVTVRRGGAVVVSNVSLTVSPGETLVVTGRNGCGKSSLLLALYGHPECAIDSGSISFSGEDVSSLDHVKRMQKGIHLLPQEASTFDSLTVEEVLHLTADLAGRSICFSEVQVILKLIPHIEKIRKRRCGALSGGERRIVGVARLLLLKPKLALLDEPLAGLSPATREQVTSAISLMASTGTAIIAAEQQDLAKWIVQPDNIVVIGGTQM